MRPSGGVALPHGWERVPAESRQGYHGLHCPAGDGAVSVLIDVAKACHLSGRGRKALTGQSPLPITLPRRSVVGAPRARPASYLSMPSDLATIQALGACCGSLPDRRFCLVSFEFRQPPGEQRVLACMTPSRQSLQ